jgi:alkylation response protein AidB-like acyl-CoA dehydrogenase
MRLIGITERCIELMLKRSLERKTFGKTLSQHGMIQKYIGIFIFLKKCSKIKN